MINNTYSTLMNVNLYYSLAEALDYATLHYSKDMVEDLRHTLVTEGEDATKEYLLDCLQEEEDFELWASDNWLAHYLLYNSKEFTDALASGMLSLFKAYLYYAKLD